MFYTYQDFEAAPDKAAFILTAINSYTSSKDYKIAVDADKYDAQQNVTINEVIPTLYTVSGKKVPDFTASNNKLASNLFHRLNTQRCMYSLGNGVSFIDPYEAAEGEKDTTKEKLGRLFDHSLVTGAYFALIHKLSYFFWNLDRVHVFKMTEAFSLDDEFDGNMRVLIRFWRISDNKPLNVVLYERDGYTTYRKDKETGKLVEVQPKTAYKVTYTFTDASEEVLSLQEENYSELPIVRMYGSRLKQSTLVGLRASIDAYDLIRSGFANDVTDCAEIYWIVENYDGMEPEDLAKFLDRIKLNHIANADTQAGGKITPYTQEIPTAARMACLQELHNGIYEDFGALDVHTIAAGATNDHIDAAYQALDENAADFEYCVSEAIIKLLALQGIEDIPQFTRARISNQKEQVEMLVQEAMWLDVGTILRKLPNLSPEEANAVMIARENEDMDRFGMSGENGEGEEGNEGTE